MLSVLSVLELHHHIRLRAGFHSDLQWWAVFLRKWNGICMMVALGRNTPEATVTSDASGSWGCGAFSDSGQWFQCEWQGAWSDVHITAKELLPIVIACALWGKEWQGKTVKCYSDNAAVVSIIRSGRSKHDLSMHLMRSLSLFTAKYEVVLMEEYLPGRLNEAADAISRGNLPLFFRQVPTAARHPTGVTGHRRIGGIGSPLIHNRTSAVNSAHLQEWQRPVPKILLAGRNVFSTYV